METISGIEIFPIIALLIFFLFFVGLIWWVYGYQKSTINELSRLPLEDNGENEGETNINSQL